jgi:7-keto-8-aminopelargonate synthetase-like enzyme
VAQQILTSITIIRGDDGTNEGRKRIQQLADNSIYFAARLREMGFIVYGDEGSPVIPLLVFNPAKIPYVLENESARLMLPCNTN